MCVNPSTCTQPCQAAIQHDRYNTRHDRVLEILFKHLQQHLPGTKVVAELAEQPYTQPADLLTDLRPDLVVHSPGQLHLLQLTVCWEANFSSAQLRKEGKYLHLLEQACSMRTQATLSKSRSDAEASSTARASSPFCPGTNQPKSTKVTD